VPVETARSVMLQILLRRPGADAANDAIARELRIANGTPAILPLPLCKRYRNDGKKKRKEEKRSPNKTRHNRSDPLFIHLQLS
jgi:hypothetical protein